jgi:predicted transcriptional regulator
MVLVTLQLGPGYVEDLSKRMKKIGISQAALGGAMVPPASPSQVTRWFTKNPKRRVAPELATVHRIEEAMLRLQRRRG